MNRGAVAGLISLGEGFTTELMRAVTSELGQKMSVFANATDETTMLGVADDAEVVGMAEAAGSSRFG